jgi:hypothetical protein
MEKSSQIAWKIVPLRHFFPLKVVPLIEVLLYIEKDSLHYMLCCSCHKKKVGVHEARDNARLI